MKLMNRSKNLEIASDVKVADTVVARAKGLLGETSLAEGHALWLDRCIRFNSIHTWFMRFPIDVVFADEKLVARRVYKNLGPWRITLPTLSSVSVFEMPAGTLERKPVDVGDKLHVGD